VRGAVRATALLAVMVLSACSDPAPRVAADAGGVGALVSAAGTVNGGSLTLRVSVTTAAPTERCWHLTEFDREGIRLGTVSACHRGEVVAASYVLGATVVVTTCSGPAVSVGPDATHVDTQEPAVAGIILVPVQVTNERASTVTTACRGESGELGPPASKSIHS
jgi:hypothetical protein